MAVGGGRCPSVRGRRRGRLLTEAWPGKEGLGEARPGLEEPPGSLGGAWRVPGGGPGLGSGDQGLWVQVERWGPESGGPWGYRALGRCVFLFIFSLYGVLRQAP